MNTARRRVLAVALLAALVLLGAVACSSLGKQELGERLAALPKNAPLVARGRQSAELAVPDGADGTRAVQLEWVDTGAPAQTSAPGRRAVLLVHGTPASLYDWVELIEGGVDARGSFGGLAAERRVLAPDLPGHGLTRTEVDPVDFAFCAETLAVWLRAQRADALHVVGHSYGGEVALRLALDHPELVASLTLVDSAGLSRRDDEWLPEEQAMRNVPGAGFGWLLNARDSVRGALQVHFSDPVDDELVEEMFLLLENAENWGAMVDLARDENGEREGDLGSLSVPTLLLWGADDAAYTVERFAERFEAKIPDAKLRLIDGVGHYPQHEAPRETLAALRAWFAANE